MDGKAIAKGLRGDQDVGPGADHGDRDISRRLPRMIGLYSAAYAERGAADFGWIS